MAYYSFEGQYIFLCRASKNHASNQGKPLNKMASVLRFFLFRARNPESVLKLYGPSFSSKEKNVQLAFSKCLVSSLYKNSTTNMYFRGTQRIVSVEYLFGRPVIASNFRLGKCHLELS